MEHAIRFGVIIAGTAVGVAAGMGLYNWWISRPAAATAP